jgi:hypothetical protein
MRFIVLSVLFLSLLGTAFGQGHQGPYYSLGGYGNVLYPGTGHAPQTPPGGINGPNFTGRIGGPGTGRGFRAPDHPQHHRTVVVPYPVFYSGYGGYDPSYSGDQAPPPADPNATPSVVINQTFVPQQSNPVVREYTGDAPPEQQSGMRLYQNPSYPYADAAQSSIASARRVANDDEPTLYLIAFKDHSIIQALGYWMEGGALHYVSVEHTLNQVSMDLIDRDLSQRLNDERGVQFKLPAR